MSEEKPNIIHVAFGRDGLRGRIDAPEASVHPAEASVVHERDSDPTRELYAANEAARVTGVTASRLRYWSKSGFLTPTGEEGKRRLYTFQDLIAIRAAKGLLDHGVSLQRVRSSIENLRSTLPRVTKPLVELRVQADGPSIVVRSSDSTFDASTGQLLIDFDVSDLHDAIVRELKLDSRAPALRRAAYDFYLEGCRLDEDEVTFDRAEEAYREAIDLDPSLASALTNLGNLRFRRGFPDEAESLYRRALELDAAQPEAFYNLGFLYFEKGELPMSIACFEQALAMDPAFADAHFNLAMAYEEIGKAAVAKPHWETYLQLDPKGTWSEIAKRHLGR